MVAEAQPIAVAEANPTAAAEPEPIPLHKRYDLEMPPPSYVDDYGSTYFLLPAPTAWQAKSKYNKAEPTPAVNVYNSQNNNNNGGSGGERRPEVIVITLPPAQAAPPAPAPTAILVTVTETKTKLYDWNDQALLTTTFTRTETVATATVTARDRDNWFQYKYYEYEHKAKVCQNQVVPGLAAGLGIAGTFMIIFLLQLIYPRLNFWSKLTYGTLMGTASTGKRMFKSGQSALAGRRSDMEYRKLVGGDRDYKDDDSDAGQESSRGLLRPSGEEVRGSLV
ncbi:hypothetical protein BJ508DRAFT_417278 [Ascobolus immersus RN42]|uniref:Uncharacterized protein n=1 Tax=Ascobolus immersus RN42 TaxID=1160509 RepID=A0A3N4HVF0_ASCIM|nr:hypothetical protein BJ508DRAFT_417278 [Ascobolus immersus RN42]